MGGRVRGLGAAQRLVMGAVRPRHIAHAGRNAKAWQKAVAVGAVLALNVALFLAPIDWNFLGGLAYPGAFLLTLIANAAIVVPVPYIPIVANIALTVQLPVLVVLLGALGSTLGESVGYAIGRVEKDVFEGHAWFERIRSFFMHPWRSALFLFLFAVPFNPVFDVAGIGAGAMGVPFRTFFIAVFLGRLVRLAIVVAVAFELIALGLLRLRA